MDSQRVIDQSNTATETPMDIDNEQCPNIHEQRSTLKELNSIQPNIVNGKSILLKQIEPTEPYAKESKNQSVFASYPAWPFDGDCSVVCPVCFLLFSDVVPLYEHLECHLPKDYVRQSRNSGQTPEDNMEAKAAVTYQTVEKTNLIKVYPCRQCQKTFRTKYNLRQHQIAKEHLDCENMAPENDRNSTGQPPDDFILVEKCFNCKRCEKSFEKKSHLKHHTENNCWSRKDSKDSMEEVKKCKSCWKYFTSLESLKAHEKVHTKLANLRGANSPTCTHCKASFLFTEELEQHAAAHPLKNKYPYVCLLCGINLHPAVELVTHMQADCHMRTVTVEDMKSFGIKHECPHCGETFETLHKLDYHLAMLNMSRSQFTCTVCNEVSDSLLAFMDHMESHGELQYCPLCQAFIQKGRMREHMRLKKHSGACTWAQIKNDCGICGANFKHINQLNKHFKSMTTNAKTFRCSACFKTFNSYTTPAEIQKHMKENHADLIKCDICYQCFMSREDRHFHECSHEMSNYKCCHCQENFTQIKTFTAHVKAVAKGEIIHCQVCSMVFPDNNTLAVHSSKHKPTEYVCSICFAITEEDNLITPHLVKHFPCVPLELIKYEHCTVCTQFFMWRCGYEDHKCAKP